ncbi:hypothetical protein [Catenulispora rubra]|uniref:hypothetical protein n=1 Tax=Catenulispora rubra TaxID=280293 RepID=UPI0018920088|nr:hypothetical protein [Catenulispora rubra]
MMLNMDVRRLAAIDIFGTRGTRRRRRIVLTEFIGGAIATAAFGIWLLASSSGFGAQVFALWLLGAGANYVTLTAYAFALSRPGALDTELAGVDTDRELHRYSALQVWIIVPLSLVVFTLRDATAHRTGI